MAILELTGVTKHYGGLRPLRLRELRLDPGASLAVAGFDAPMAETLTNLVTGATLADEGQVTVLGRSTAAITDSDEWLAFLDRVGAFSDRIVLIEPMSVLENVAMPLTLSLDDAPADVRRAAEAIGREVGLAETLWARPAGAASPLDRQRIRLARALALDPALLLVEHPASGLSTAEAAAFASDVRRVIQARAVSALILAATAASAAAVADRVLTIRPATGELVDAGPLARLRHLMAPGIFRRRP